MMLLRPQGGQIRMLNKRLLGKLRWRQFFVKWSHGASLVTVYVVDHIKPLACGGADDPSNMQWQTVAAARAKDRTERKACTPAAQ